MIVITDVNLGWSCVLGSADTMKNALELMKIDREEDLTEKEWNEQGVHFHKVAYYTGK